MYIYTHTHFRLQSMYFKTSIISDISVVARHRNTPHMLKQTTSASKLSKRSCTVVRCRHVPRPRARKTSSPLSCCEQDCRRRFTLTHAQIHVYIRNCENTHIHVSKLATSHRGLSTRSFHSRKFLRARAHARGLSAFTLPLHCKKKSCWQHIWLSGQASELLALRP